MKTSKTVSSLNIGAILPDISEFRASLPQKFLASNVGKEPIPAINTYQLSTWPGTSANCQSGLPDNPVEESL